MEYLQTLRFHIQQLVKDHFQEIRYPGSGATDMNSTLNKDVKPFWDIANYLSERGFELLLYDKRGTGPNLTIQDSNVWET